ncbi:hypothetical protein [Microbacterium maritypicum]
MSDDNDVWAVDDWVPADVKRRSARALATVLTLTIIGGGLYLAGIVTIRSALGWPFFVSGLLVLVAVIVLVTAANPYRRVSGDAELPRHIFHLSPERWDEGATVTLEVQRCRKKQFIAENRWGRRSRLVYFFPQRPTRQQALGQTLSGRRRPRYLYELEVLSPFDAVYERVAARATTTDLTARVVRRQPAQAWSRRHDATVDT